MTTADDEHQAVREQLAGLQPSARVMTVRVNDVHPGAGPYGLRPGSWLPALGEPALATGRRPLNPP